MGKGKTLPDQFFPECRVALGIVSFGGVCSLFVDKHFTWCKQEGMHLDGGSKVGPICIISKEKNASGKMLALLLVPGGDGGGSNSPSRRSSFHNATGGLRNKTSSCCCTKSQIVDFPHIHKASKVSLS